jgi:hypothetical protein
MIQQGEHASTGDQILDDELDMIKMEYIEPSDPADAYEQ